MCIYLNINAKLLPFRNTENVIDQYKTNGQVCVVGDFNCHFSSKYGNRFWGKNSPNARICNRMVDVCDLSILDGDDKYCNGPTYTFHVDGVGTSYVDHCMVSSMLTNYISECVIHNDCIENTSDHLPISVKINVQNVIEFNGKSSCK